MKNQHIVNLIESKPLSRLDDSELAAIERHADACDACRRAWQAAQLSAQLLSERAAEVIEPSPFFATRVMAALRQQQATRVSPFLRAWQAAQAMVYAMVAVVVMVGALSWLAYQPQPVAPEQVSVLSSDATDLLLPEPASSEMSYGQVISTIYDLGE
ncbi:MAG TPA: hypothetical protein VNQ79_20320 [Blastocatellia bacterium]|nr:hypothetical protein [Blastocatellia bacterium]